MQRFLTLFFYVFIAIITVVSLVLLLPAFHKKRQMEQRVVELEEELANRNHECMKLKQKLYDLQHNPRAIEEIARERFNFCREGEIIYTYDELEESVTDE